jgi:hypothetical protein
MSFEPTGFLKRTRTKEYEAYCQGIEDVMEIVGQNAKFGNIVWGSMELRELVLNLVVEAADDFTNGH